MEKQKRIINLDEKIYLATFNKPRYKAEISRMLYGKEKKTIYPKINELVKKGWIKELKDYSPEEEDGRAKKRVYLKGTIKPFYDRLISTLKKYDKSLSKGEEKQLKQFIESDFFRNFCGDNPKHVTIGYVFEQMYYWFAYSIVNMNFQRVIYKDIEFFPELKNMDEELISLIASLGSYRSDFFIEILYSFTNEFWDVLYDFVHMDKKEQQRSISKIDKWHKKQKEIFEEE